MTERRNADSNSGVPGQIGWLNDEATSPSPEIGALEEAALPSEGAASEVAILTVAPWSISKSVSASARRPLLVTIGLFLLAVVLIIGLIFLLETAGSLSSGSGATSSLSPDTYGLCTGGATELIITGPDGVPQHVKCP